MMLPVLPGSCSSQQPAYPQNHLDKHRNRYSDSQNDERNGHDEREQNQKISADDGGVDHDISATCASSRERVGRPRNVP
jgi:hypothetical protein